MTEANAINYVDLILLGIMILSIIVGVIRGLTQEILGIAGWMGAVFLTIYSLPLMRPMARDIIASPLIADITAGVFIFLLTLILLTLVCRSFSSRIKESSLGGIDRSLGLLFGAGRGFFLLSLLYLMGVSLTKRETWPEKMRTAKAIPFLDKGALIINALLPEDFKPKHADKLVEDLRTSEEIMRNLARLNPSQEKKSEEVSYNNAQKQKINQLFDKN